MNNILKEIPKYKTPKWLLRTKPKTAFVKRSEEMTTHAKLVKKGTLIWDSAKQGTYRVK